MSLTQDGEHDGGTEQEALVLDQDTKPKSKRGGVRPGSGMKPRPGALAPDNLPPEVIRAAAKMQFEAQVGDAPESIFDLEKLALATLKQVMESCPQDAPRATAAKTVLDHIRADKTEKVAEKGKKLQRAAAAEEIMASGGKFAAPPPPGGRFQ